MIKYFKNKDINKQKWDTCINDATNGLIYGYSWYLDIIADKWDALVYDDYVAIMPLIWNKKYGVYYIYQPPFVQQTGIFSNKPIHDSTIEKFINSIPKKFIYININFNSANKFRNKKLEYKKNYTLDLSKSYQETFKGFNSNTQRNIRIAQKSGMCITNDVNADELISFKQKTSPNKILKKALAGMKNYISYCKEQKCHKIMVIRNKNKQLIGASFFTFSHNRWYYILAATNNEGKVRRAGFHIINEFIKENCENNMVLDFEGSEIPGIARLFDGFGANPEYYYRYHENKMPFFLKWIKK